LPPWRKIHLAEESDLERTEPASARRLEKARAEGQVPQSRELMAFLIMAAAGGGFWVAGDWLTDRAAALLRHGLSFDRATAFDPNSLTHSIASLSWEGLLLTAPIFALTVAATLATPVALGGWTFAPAALTPRFERLDPLKGVGRMFSWHSIGELVKAILKALLIGGVIYWVISRQQGQLFALLGESIEAALASFARMLMFAVMAMIVGLAAIAAIDVPFQLWRYYQGLRMTREELRQEMKELEGDPLLKARIRSQQREIARRRMMTEVPKADVVVTNPSHFAVALKYESGAMAAPVVVAKGMNIVAQKIREVATEHRVPILEAPPLARALYRHAELGDQIPATLYAAVAEVMAYVYQLNRYFASAAQGSALPPPPAAIVVPPGMDPGAVGAEA
jgi:flagellar biosynthesis protein FlhB